MEDMKKQVLDKLKTLRHLFIKQKQQIIDKGQSIVSKDLND